MAEFIFYAMAAYGKGISGSDRIFIEFAKRWSQKHSLTIYVWSEGYKMCLRQNLKQVDYKIINLGIWCKLGFIPCYFARIIAAVLSATRIPLKDNIIVYSASEFWMDSLPALVIKLRAKNATWVAAWYQTAPSPLEGFSSGRYRFKALLYWLAQFPIKPLITQFADYVLVNNNAEMKNFPRHARTRQAIVVLGAVNVQAIAKWKKLHTQQPKTYAAVFQGRFHPQKGVVELIEIWRKVVDKMPSAKLAMIGDGPLMAKVQSKIKQLGLSENIKLFGYLFDGSKKYALFSQSKIVVHPAFYDSGGMASAEAMAFGLPCVGFNLPAYKFYYPKGMLQAQVGNISGFAANVIKLLENPKLRVKIGTEAEDEILKNWSWDTRAREVLERII